MKKIFLILTLSSLLLVACSSSGDANLQNTDSAESTIKQEIDADSLLDQELFTQATASEEIALCEEIQNLELQESCQQVIEGFQLTEQAITERNTSICEEIKLDRYKSSCLTQVEIAIEQDQKDQEAEERAAKNSKIEQEAFAEMDLSKCDAIEEERSRTSCKASIAFSLATQAKDPSLCEGIGDDGMEKICRNNAENAEDIPLN